MGGNRGRGGWSRDNPPAGGMREYQRGVGSNPNLPANRFNASYNSQPWRGPGFSQNHGFQRPHGPVRFPPPFLSKKQEKNRRWHEQERMKREAEERRQAEIVKRKERERDEKRRKKEEESNRIAQQEKEQEEEEARRWAEKNEKIRASLKKEGQQGALSQSPNQSSTSYSCQVDEDREQQRRKKPAWVKMGRGLHELDLPITSSDLAYVGQGAVQGGEEDETVERPTDLPLAAGAAVVLPPGSGNSEGGWRSWTNWDSDWAPWGMLGSQEVLGNSGIGRKRTLSESSCISTVSITPRKRRLSEADTVCKNVTEQAKLTTPVRKYKVNPKALQSARSTARHLGKQTVDTDDGLDLGKLLELEYSSSDETLSEGNKKACSSFRHGRGWCKFGDNCVVRREGALTENPTHQEDQGEGEKTKRIKTEEEVETQHKKKEARLGVKSIANVDPLCRSKFHGIGKCKCARRASGTEVIIGTVSPDEVGPVSSSNMQVEMQQQERRVKRDRLTRSEGMSGKSNSGPLPPISPENDPFDADENQEHLRLIFEEETRLVSKLREKQSRLKAEAETRKSINLSISRLVEQLTASEKRQEEEEEGIQLISDQLEYYGKLKQEQLAAVGVQAHPKS